MKKTLWLTTLGAAFIAGTVAFAQETGTQDTAEQPAPESTEASPAAPAISLGEEVPVAPQPGQIFIRETIKDWEVRCVFDGTEVGTDCQIYQLLVDGEGNPTAEIAIFRLPEGGPAEAGANVITPLGTLLTSQVTLQVDKGTAKRYPFTACTQIGCLARIGFEPSDVLSYKRGANGILVMVNAAAPNQPVGLRISLSGFTAAYDTLTVPVPPQQ